MYVASPIGNWRPSATENRSHVAVKEKACMGNMDGVAFIFNGLENLFH